MRLLQRLQAYLTSPAQANERLSDMLIELRHRGIDFRIEHIREEDGTLYFYAQSVDYPRGYISTTGETLEELEENLKDAIFTAFSVPARYTNPDQINFNPPLIARVQARQEVPQQIHVTT